MDIRDEVQKTYVKTVETGCCGDLHVQEHSFGCGDPVRVAQLKPGEKVLDLGCGIGFDLMIAAKAVGVNGHAYGLDMTIPTLKKARTNISRLRIANATLLCGSIEEIPLFDEGVNVVLSNGAINLSPDKDRVLNEAYRVLVHGGRLVVSDVVLLAPTPSEFKIDPALLGCISGALQVEEYREKLINAGFTNITITLTKQNAPNIEAIKKRMHLQEDALQALDDISASALILAYKP